MLETFFTSIYMLIAIGVYIGLVSSSKDREFLDIMLCLFWPLLIGCMLYVSTDKGRK